jgi:hypothetical protein
MDTIGARTVRAGTLVAEAWIAPLRHFSALLRFGTGPLLLAMFFWPPAYSLRVGDEAHS